MWKQFASWHYHAWPRRTTHGLIHTYAASTEKQDTLRGCGESEPAQAAVRKQACSIAGQAKGHGQGREGQGESVLHFNGVQGCLVVVH